MSRLKFLFLLLCFLVGWVPSAFAWPEFSAETFAQHKKWRQERGEDKRRGQERQERSKEQAGPPSRPENADNANSGERRQLSPEERRELRRQIRRANQDGNR